MVFIPNRSMLDIFLVVNEVVDFTHRNKKGLFVFKVDFEKAFDLVSWVYLLYVINRMNFGSRWLNWIQACVFSSSMSILIYGCPTNDFHAKGGCDREIHSLLFFSY